MISKNRLMSVWSLLMFCSHSDAATTTVLTVPVTNVVSHGIKITFLDSWTFCIPAACVLFQEGAVNGSCRLGEGRILNQNPDKDSLPVKSVFVLSKINLCTELWLCERCSLPLSVFGVLPYSLIMLLSLSSFYSPSHHTPRFVPLIISGLWVFYIETWSLSQTRRLLHNNKLRDKISGLGVRHWSNDGLLNPLHHKVSWQVTLCFTPAEFYQPTGGRKKKERVPNHHSEPFSTVINL